MGMLDIDLGAIELISRAPSDPDAARDLLLRAAEFMRRGEALPSNLAKYLADAIEASMHKPNGYRLNALGVELNLAASNRRPAADWLEVGHAFDLLMDPFDPATPAPSQNAAKIDVANDFGISEATAVRYWKTYLAALEEHDRITREECAD